MGVHGDEEHYLCEQCEPRSYSKVRLKWTVEASNELMMPVNICFPQCSIVKIKPGNQMCSGDVISVNKFVHCSLACILESGGRHISVLDPFWMNCIVTHLYIICIFQPNHSFDCTWCDRALFHDMQQFSVNFNACTSFEAPLLHFWYT